MFHNDSLAFLDMIKNQKASHTKDCRIAATDTETNRIAATDTETNRIAATDTETNRIAAIDTETNRIAAIDTDTNKIAEANTEANKIAVIDTETNWHDQVMSIGIAFADPVSYKCTGRSYYIFKEESRVGGMYSSVLRSCDENPRLAGRAEAMRAIRDELKSHAVSKIFAYNAKFDYGHLPELSDFEWYDIMRLAAYKQFNHAIPDTAACCKTGRLKTNYGVEPIIRMLSGDNGYFEVHNAVRDAEDELRIMELLGQALEKYECAKI